MANRRDTFAKRQRESDLKEKARAKAARRMAKRNDPRTTKGPEIGTFEEVHAIASAGSMPAAATPPAVVAPPAAPPAAASGDDPADPTR